MSGLPSTYDHSFEIFESMHLILLLTIFYLLVDSLKLTSRTRRSNFPSAPIRYEFALPLSHCTSTQPSRRVPDMMPVAFQSCIIVQGQVRKGSHQNYTSLTIFKARALIISLSLTHTLTHTHTHSLTLTLSFSLQKSNQIIKKREEENSFSHIFPTH